MHLVENKYFIVRFMQQQIHDRVQHFQSDNIYCVLIITEGFENTFKLCSELNHKMYLVTP